MVTSRSMTSRGGGAAIEVPRLSLAYIDRLAELGIAPSVGSRGDGYDIALAEMVNGYYNAEPIYGPARTEPCRTIEDVELATPSWVHWHNTSRLHGYLGDIPPTEFEAAFTMHNGPTNPLIGIQ